MSSIETDPHEPDLAPLRAALKALPTPAVDEAALRRVFREHRRAQAGGARATARARTIKYWALAAAVSSVAIGGIVGLVRMTERRAAAPLAATPPPAVAAFQPLWYSPEVVPGAAYSVVRVRIPLSSLALLPDATADGMIEADLLVGEDGLARGIRFNGPGALLVSKASQ